MPEEVNKAVEEKAAEEVKEQPADTGKDGTTNGPQNTESVDDKKSVSEFLKKAGDTVSDGVSTLTEKTREAVNRADVHRKIAGEKEAADAGYLLLGKKYYQLHADSPENELKDVVDQINAHVKTIAALEASLVKNERACPQCGQIVADDADFCTNCGAKLPPVEKTMVTCPRCGAPLKPGARFCVNCGYKVVQE